MMNITKLIEEYPIDYCEMLELAYGKHLMSEGGTKAIDRFVEGLNLNNKDVLDIGSGLGGLAFHLASIHQANVTGLEINQAMIAEATARIPATINDKVNFCCYDGNMPLPFPDNSFDIVLTKGVLVHIEDKTPLLTDIKRLLKHDGTLLINDWLSSTADKLGKSIEKMAEAENLTLFPQTENNYRKLLERLNFKNISINDHSQLHNGYYQDIIQHLQSDDIKKTFCDRFGKDAYNEHLHGYQYIQQALAAGDLMVTTIRAKIDK